jgi:hypothetical protein
MLIEGQSGEADEIDFGEGDEAGSGQEVRLCWQRIAEADIHDDWLESPAGEAGGYPIADRGPFEHVV